MLTTRGFLALVVALVAIPVASAQLYQVTPLIVGGNDNYFTPQFVNNNGQIAGTVFGASGLRLACWESGVVTELPDRGFGGSIVALNDAGVVAGNVMDEAGNARGAIWDAAGRHELASAGGFYSSIVDLNNVGQLLLQRNGASYLRTGESDQLIDDDPQTLVASLNNTGIVAGITDRFPADAGGFLWQNGSLTSLGDDPTIDPNLGVEKLNDKNQVLAATLVKDYVWQAGGFSFLTHWPSRMTALNNFGQLAGRNTDHGAFLWEAGQERYLNDLLPSLGWDFQYLMDLNDNGQLVGRGMVNGRSEGYLLTPVPEPWPVLGLLVGLVCYCFSQTTYRRNKAGGF